MKIPLTSYGMPQVALWPVVTVAAMALFFATASGSMPVWVVLGVECLMAAVLTWVLSFFRDPERRCPSDDHLILSPADGKVTDVGVVDSPEFSGGKAFRIGIFLSIFNVHINRSPCRATVDKIEYRPGMYKNALNPASSRLNESNNVYMTRLRDPADRLLVRQVSGAIARRIVCKTSKGKVLNAGERFGMIKFGSRTELYVPDRPDMKCLVSVGQPVRAGLTVLVRYQTCQG
jgi:phosphatidylserine decarboxylase